MITTLPSSLPHLPIILLALLAGLTPAPAGDWPNWRGPNRDGVSSETGWNPRSISEVKWQAEVGIGFSSMTISQGRLYTLGHNGDKGAGGRETVFCLDPATGREIWSDSYEADLMPNLHEGGPASTPTVEGDNLYSLSKDGRLIRYHAPDGKRLWERNLLKESSMEKPAEWGFASSPLIVGEALIVEADQTLAFHKETGAVLWKGDRHQAAYGTPTDFEFKGQTCLATLKNDGLLILNAATGKTLTFQPWKTRFETSGNSPIVRGDLIFISTGYQRGCALFRFTGSNLELVYESKVMSNHMSNCVRLGNQLYGFDGNTHGSDRRQLKCIDFDTGKERWAQEGFGIGALCAAGDRLIVLSEKGELIIAQANPEKFTLLHRAQVNGGRHWNVPVLANGFLYVRNAAGRLVALKTDAN